MKKTITPLLTLLVISCFLWSHSLAAQVVLYTEEFNHPLDEIPPGWVIEADQPSEWSVNNSQIAGGVAPELFMNYGFAAGLSRLISVPVDITGHQELSLTYKQYLINYSGDWGEVIGTDVTFDGGTTWQTLWEAPLGLWNIPQDEFTYYFNAPAGAEEMQFAFRFEGNNNALNAWTIDDIVIEAVTNSDLVATSVTGNTTPNVGEETIYMVEIVNGGMLTQNDYTITLFTEGGDEIASVAGQPIVFADKQFVSLAWTPVEDDLDIPSLYASIEVTGDDVPANNQTAPLLVNVQASNTETAAVGSGTYPSTEVPYNFFSQYSLTQTIYKSEDIGVTESEITGIQYTCQFDNDIDGVPVQIYLGETEQDDISTGGWIAPSSMTLVFDGLVDFKKGFNNLYIPLNTPYNYTGSNLVVYSNKSHTEQVLWVGFSSTEDGNLPTSFGTEGDNAPFDALNPPQGFPKYYAPNITLFFSSGTMSVIEHSDTQVVIYPNPATDLLHIQTVETVQEIRVVNALGQEVLYERGMANNQHSLKVQNLAAGLYLVQVVTEKGATIKKVQIF